MTARGAGAFIYDLNGNLTSDGTNTYTWDARDQLVSISGGATASFGYDTFGRRVQKTTGGQTTNYLYDGANVVQEQAGGTVNILAGGVGEVFARGDASGVTSPLTDVLGSTLELTDAAGNTQTSYTYEPFGKTMQTGATSSNKSQYTGRENDGTGLHFNRARYYSPTLQRFISEDPIGLAGGDNLYAYAGNNPTGAGDAFGMSPQSGPVNYLRDCSAPLK